MIDGEAARLVNESALSMSAQLTAPLVDGWAVRAPIDIIDRYVRNYLRGAEPRDSILAVSRVDERLWSFDTRSGETRARVTLRPPYKLLFSPNGNKVFAAGGDRTIKV